MRIKVGKTTLYAALQDGFDPSKGGRITRLEIQEADPCDSKLINGLRDRGPVAAFPIELV
jgi:hypothetical protein